MTRLLATIIAATTLTALAALAGAQAQTLDSFGVLSATPDVTNTGPTVIYGNVGVSPASSVIGLGTTPSPGIVHGEIHANDSVAIAAQVELINRINVLNGLSPTQDLTGQNLGGLTLTPGVYHFDTTAQLTGTLTLDAQGNPAAKFVFQIGSALTTASAASVVLVNGAQGANISWNVGSSATLGSTTDFAGRILAVASITLVTGATIDCGSAWAHTGEVTLDSNVINGICAFSAFGDVLGPTATENERAIAAALDAYVTANGTLPAEFQAILLLPPEDQAAALAQLSGQVATGAAPTAMQAMDSFLSQIFDFATAEDQNAQPTPNQPPRTVKALGYADEKKPTAVDSAFLALTVNPARHSVWASAYGSRGTTEGDVLVGSTDRFASVFGVAAGYDYRIAPDLKVGVSFGVGHTNYDMTDSLGGGSSDVLQVAAYGKKDFGAAYLAAAVAYAFNSVSTNRSAPLVTTDTFAADFDAHDFAAQVETGIHFGWVTPYAAVRAQAFYTPGYQETSTPAGSAFALAYDDSTTYSARTELGVRLAKAIALRNGTTLGLNGRVAWAHDFSSAPSVVATFQSLPGSPFTVTGASQGGDSILVSAGADIGFMNGLSIGGSFDGAFSEGAQSYGGRGHVRLSW